VALGLTLLLVNLLLLNYLASRHHVRADWTATAVYELAPRTVAAVRDLRAPVRLIMVMAPRERLRGASIYHETRELLRRLGQHSRRIRVERVDPDLNPTRAELLARKHDLRRRDLGQGGVVVASGERSRFVPASAMAELELRDGVERVAAFKGEQALLAALLAVTSRERLAACFTRGHSEGAIESYAAESYGYIVDDVRRDGFRIEKVGAGRIVKAGGLSRCSVVVIVGARTAFAPPELDALDRYLRRGGRMLVLFGPVLDRKASRQRHIGLERLLRDWGIQVMDNIVLDQVGVPGEQPLMTWATRDGYSGDHPVGRAMSGRVTVWPMVREVRPGNARRRGVRAETLVRTSTHGWAETDLASLRGERPLRLDRSVDTAGPVSVAVAARRGSIKTETRLVVIGTDHGVLNRRIGQPEVRDYNRDLFLAALGWAAATSDRVAVGPKVPRDLRLTLTEGQLTRVLLITVVGLPLASLFLGVVVWRRRRR
jgi:ABC-type uncharacterized transport system involved in gliding motility auxiliary subunit